MRLFLVLAAPAMLLSGHTKAWASQSLPSTANAPAVATAAASAAVSPALASRAADLVAFVNGEKRAEQIFHPLALDQMPAARLNALADMLRSRRGPALGVSRIEATSATEGTAYIDFKGVQLPVRFNVSQREPHLIGTMMVNPAP